MITIWCFTNMRKDTKMIEKIYLDLSSPKACIVKGNMNKFAIGNLNMCRFYATAFSCNKCTFVTYILLSLFLYFGALKVRRIRSVHSDCNDEMIFIDIKWVNKKLQFYLRSVPSSIFSFSLPILHYIPVYFDSYKLCTVHVCIFHFS